MLKSGLLDERTTPDYDQLREVNRQVQRSALAAYHDRHDSIVIIGDDITNMPLKLPSVGILTDSLQRVPQGSRRRSWQNVFKNLEQERRNMAGSPATTRNGEEAKTEHLILQTAQKRQIAYLEAWCKRAETQQESSNCAFKEPMLPKTFAFQSA